MAKIRNSTSACSPQLIDQEPYDRSADYSSQFGGKTHNLMGTSPDHWAIPLIPTKNGTTAIHPPMMLLCTACFSWRDKRIPRIYKKHQ